MDLFRVRLNCIDHYQAAPSSFDPQLSIDPKQKYKIPIIRIFGATETGQKVCAHVHGMLPYLYIECDDNVRNEPIDAYIQRLWLSIDHALAVSYRRDESGSKTAFVAHISPIKAIPFYGYHVGYRPYLKIYLLNPLHITRLADLLRQGAVMSRRFQPYESHMQYIPQWMCDYNLYGCDYLDCINVKFRLPVPSADDLDTDLHKWHSASIPPRATDTDTELIRQSHCALEIDIRVQDITNRHSVAQRNLHNDLQEMKSSPETKAKLVPSLESLWRAESKRRRQAMGISDPDSSPFPPEVLISVSAEARGDPGKWVHEEEFRSILEDTINREARENAGHEINYDNIVAPESFTEQMPTAFQSIEDLYTANVETTNRSFQAQDEDTLPEASQYTDIDVDEDMIWAALQGLETHTRTKPDEYSDKEFGAGPIEETGLNPLASASRQIRDDEDAISEHLSASQRSINSSAGGIRDHGDLSHAQEDAFLIPDGFTSNIRETMARRKRGLLAGAEEYGKPPKRRKGPLRGPTSLERPAINNLNNSQGRSLDSISNENAIPLSRSEALVDSSKSGKLPFPVVKSPHAFKKSSQQSQDRKEAVQSETSWERSTADGATQGSAKQSPSKGSQMIASQGSFNLQGVDWETSYLKGFNVEVQSINKAPPTIEELRADFESSLRANVFWQAPYYGDEKDFPQRKFAFAGKEHTVGGRTALYFPEFDTQDPTLAFADDQPVSIPDSVEEDTKFLRQRQLCTLKTWEVAAMPPSREDVEAWLNEEVDKGTKHQAARPNLPIPGVFSQVDTATQLRKQRHVQPEQNTSSVKYETQYMSVMSLEIHVNTRGNFVPDPEKDSVAAIFWRLEGDDHGGGFANDMERPRSGVLVVSESAGIGHEISQLQSIHVAEEEDELELFNHMVDIVHSYDPDVLAGFEVHGGSWGYIIERARHRYETDLCDAFSRTITDAHGRFGRESDKWGFNQTSTIRVTGRHMINIWRAMKAELNLLQYTMENIVSHVLKKRIPHYSFSDLTRWWQSSNPADLAKVIQYFTSRTQLDLEILEKNELVARTSEQARLLGVDFFSVFSRGSQFKVESLMFRIAKPENFLLVSPSREQVGQQNALECLPLVMEPHSAFYTSPVLVLDFQSLYPSVMIAYNYCYSTFLGRVNRWRGQDKMGFADYSRQSRLLELLKDNINIAPNGMMYAKPKVRKSLLAKMLGEILETRVMIKSGMKADKDDKALQRLLHNRQLALKFIANVTYGYTSASFSGRMPCSEIADSIVQTGRETLEKAIALIHSVERWGAEVVYGDTDSLFVHLKGKSKSQAFDIGEQIAEAITQMNPKPIKLKFEKVYHPCVLLAKKRYVGFKYESRDQQEPDFDAKGIETVRRDGTPAEQKIEEHALKLLFRTQDLSQVKAYFQDQCSKIMRGKVSLQDFCFAREVKLGTYSDKGPPPPGALISTRKMLADPRAEPQYGERVPYLVVTGAPGARLIDRCVAPEVLLQNEHMELDAEYYISKNLIPPLERIFNLVGANVRAWYDEMPKIHRIRRIENTLEGMGAGDNWIGFDDDDGVLGGPAAVGRRGKQPMKRTMESYMQSAACIVCRENKVDANVGAVCGQCLKQPHLALLTLRTRVNQTEKKAISLEKVCRSCAGLKFGEDVRCNSKDCPVFYARTRHMAGLRGARRVTGAVIRRLENMEMKDKDLEW